MNHDRSEASDLIVSSLLKWYRTDPDPGVHGAIDWLLRRHQSERPLAQADEQLGKEAKEVRSQIEGREGTDEDSDAGFASIVTWLLI